MYHVYRLWKPIAYLISFLHVETCRAFTFLDISWKLIDFLDRETIENIVSFVYLMDYLYPSRNILFFVVITTHLQAGLDLWLLMKS